MNGIEFFDIDDIELMGLPESLGCFSSQNLLVGHHFRIVVLQILVRNDVVILEILVHIRVDFHLLQKIIVKKIRSKYLP